jgi:hypothetical protein
MLELLRDGHGVEPWAPTGQLEQIRHGDGEFLAAVDLNRAELSRRRRHRMGSVTRRPILEVLLSLPRGVAVPLALLSAQAHRTVANLPAGVVDIADDQVCVLLEPALSLRSAGVIASTWKAGLRRSASFASYCARYVVVDAAPRRVSRAAMEAATMEARFYGVGLAVHRDGELDWLVSPAPFDVERFTASSWLMAERLLDELPAASL